MKVKKLIFSTLVMLIIFSNVALCAERVSLGFLYGEMDTELITRTNGAINQVSPSYLDISSKGDLIISNELTEDFVKQMHEMDILVIPFLSNHWVRAKGIAAINNAENLSSQIIETVNTYNLDGINVDIENLTPKEKEAFSEFIRILSEKFPKDKILSVSVAANPDAEETGWQGSYDYEKLDKYVDYLFVMTYDEHSQGGECGPVASLEFVRKSIEYTLNYVSKDKIVIGIPFYGRYWKTGEEYGGEAVVIGAIPSLISKNKGIVKYNPNIGEACVTFSINEPKIKSKINGRTLDDGEYTIWYPNEESIKAKLDLVNEYDLLGAGAWALGQEKVDVWTYYKNELNKTPYVTEREEQMRQEYEALVVDLSNLELPELLRLTKIEKDIDLLGKENKKAEVIFEEEEHIHTEKQELEDANYIEIENLERKNKKKYIKYQEVCSKIIHRYRYSRKDL